MIAKRKTTNGQPESDRSRSGLVRWTMIVAFLCALPGAGLAQRVNLAKLQEAAASSTLGNEAASYAVDGIVSKDARWKSNGPGPHWLSVRLALPMEIGSAQVFTGSDDDNAVASFVLQARISGGWVNIAGTSVTNNTQTELNLVFPNSVTTSEIRFYTTEPEARIKELALYDPNGPSGYPLGTDVTLNLAWQRSVQASSIYQDHYPNKAVDGFIDFGARWSSADDPGDDTLEVTLSSSHILGSAHVYTGSGDASPPVATFKLQYWTGATWSDIPGASVENNSSLALRFDFAEPITTSRVRFHAPGSGRKRLQELVVFTANGGAGHPLGTSISLQPRPTATFEDYSDSYYRIRNRAADRSLVSSQLGSSLSTDEDADLDKQYQLLLNVGTDTYRLVHRVTGHCLEVAGASKASGAEIVDGDYSAMPHQVWTLAPVDGVDFQLVNAWSGMVLGTEGGGTAAGAPVTQGVSTGGASQRWRFLYETHFPKKGLAGWLDQANRFKPSWGYNWDRSGALNNGGLFMPMQHNAYWPDWNTLAQNYPAWNSRARFTALLGFNEPDRPDQADMSVDSVLGFWPRLERLNIPLVSPVTSNPWNSWMTEYMDRADALGYRSEYVGVHWYGSPSGGNAQGFVDWLWGVQNRFRRPIWITEFSTVDWGGNATWSEEDNYNFFAEFFWRAEDLPWLKKYTMFVFSGDGPANPDDPVGARGDIFKSNNSTFTPLGELYAAWDADRTVRVDTPYIVHNRSTRHRIRNLPAETAPSADSIRRSDSKVQWAWLAAPTAGRSYLGSMADGRRLSWDGSELLLAAAETTGPSVEWVFRHEQNGWYFIDHPATGTRLRLTDEGYLMEDDSVVRDSVRWRFIKPFQPVTLLNPPPAVPRGLAATPGIRSVALRWDPNTELDFATYSVYGRTAPNGIYALRGSGLTSPEFNVTGLINGFTYYLAVTAIDTEGNESDKSSDVTAVPSADPPPAAPTGLSAHAGFRSVSLNWDPNPEGDIAGYTVYGRPSGTLTFFQRVTGLADPQHTDQGLVNGVSYDYHVTATDSAGQESQPSMEVTAIPVADPVPPAPTGVVATAGNRSVALTWDASMEGDFASYSVYGRVTQGAAPILRASGLTEPVFTDTGLVNGATYYYRVTTLDAAGQESMFSLEVSASPSGAAGFGTYAGWAELAFAPDPAADSSPEGNPDEDELVNLGEYAFLTDPLEPDQRAVTIRLNGLGQVEVEFLWNHQATDLRYELLGSGDPGAAGGWMPVPFETVYESPEGDLRRISVRPTGQWPHQFFKVEVLSKE